MKKIQTQTKTKKNKNKNKNKRGSHKNRVHKKTIRKGGMFSALRSLLGRSSAPGAVRGEVLPPAAPGAVRGRFCLLLLLVMVINVNARRRSLRLILVINVSAKKNKYVGYVLRLFLKTIFANLDLRLVV